MQLLFQLLHAKSTGPSQCVTLSLRIDPFIAVLVTLCLQTSDLGLQDVHFRLFSRAQNENNYINRQSIVSKPGPVLAFSVIQWILQSVLPAGARSHPCRGA